MLCRCSWGSGSPPGCLLSPALVGPPLSSVSPPPLCDCPGGPGLDSTLTPYSYQCELMQAFWLWWALMKTWSIEQCKDITVLECCGAPPTRGQRGLVEIRKRYSVLP